MPAHRVNRTPRRFHRQAVEPRVRATDGPATARQLALDLRALLDAGLIDVLPDGAGELRFAPSGAPILHQIREEPANRGVMNIGDAVVGGFAA